MKYLLWIYLFLASHSSFASSGPSDSPITRNQFLETLAIARKTFSGLATDNHRRLEIFSDWNSNWTQAFARRWDTDQLLIYGGIARIPQGSQDSLALLICHELGHLYAGSPYSDEHNALSAEGQADWWATQYCWPRFAEQLPNFSLTVNERAIKAALIVTAFYASNRNIPSPALETPDPTVVEQTILTHPEPQCRLDTYLAGLLNQPRPLCWWKN